MNRAGLTFTVVGVALLCLLGAPFATGMLTENQLRQRMELLNQNPVFGAEVTAYDRGWLKSEARIELGVSPDYLAQLQNAGTVPGTDILDTRLGIIVEITHGPLAISDGVHFGAATVVARPDSDGAIVQFAEQTLGMPYLFEFRGRAGFGDSFDFDGDIPEIDYTGPEGKIEFTGLNVVGNAHGNVLNVDANGDRLSYQSMFATGLVETIRIDTQYEMRGQNVPLGTSELLIGRVFASSPMLGPEPLFEASDLRATGDFTLNDDGEKVSMSATYGAGSLVAGEEINVTNAALGISINDVDAEAVQTYYQVIQESTRNQVADPAVIMDQLTPLIEQVVAGAPSLAINPLQFTTPEGSLNGKGLIAIDPSQLPQGQAVDLQNMAVLAGIVTATIDLTVAKPLAERLAALSVRTQIAAQAAASGETFSPEEIKAMAEAQSGFMLIGLTGQGMLVDDGDNYTTALEYADGAITVNGEPMPFGMF